MAVAEGDEQGARVCDGRKTGFGKQADIVAVGKEGDHLLDVGGIGVLVEFPQREGFDPALQSGAREKTPRRAELFHDIAVQVLDLVQHRGRQHLGGVVVAEGSGNQIEFTVVHRL